MTVVDWSTLVPVVIGGALTLGGAMLGSWVGERRAMAREERDRDHERETWARNLRYESHLRFLADFDQYYKTIEQSKQRGIDEPVPDDWMNPLWDRLQSLRLVCAEATTLEAEATVLVLDEYEASKKVWEDVEVACRAYVNAVRAEFHMPPVSLKSDAL